MPVTRRAPGGLAQDSLETITIPAGVTDPLRGERSRSLSQIDETATWLVDHWQRVALSYAGQMASASW